MSESIITGGRRAGRASMVAAMAAALVAGMAGMGNGSTVANPVRSELGSVDRMNVTKSPADRVVSPSNLAASMRRLMGGHNSTRGWQRARGPGWTNAHAKRVARKARAVKAHRARSRG